ncbi:hypothetical protein KBD34_05880 [Patescibacteria group bacterium]|nr:hypothetical protein [Patescibacteria group bacterium]
MAAPARRQEEKVRRLSRKAFIEDYQALPTTESLIPVIDPTAMSREEFCAAVARSLETTGLVILRSQHADPVVREEMQLGTARFFASPTRIKRLTMTRNFQGGWTPPYSETPVDQRGYVIKLDADQRPYWEDLEDDAKERVMFGVGWRPAATRFPGLMPPTRIMVGHEAWCRTMRLWGKNMLSDTDLILGALAEHYGLPAKVFSTKGGAHYVAPTGTKMNKFRVGKVVVRLHSDMGLLTGHEKSIAFFSKSGKKASCGGLIVWTKNGRKIRVVMPEGCRLFQAGMQLEYVTGGKIVAGMHQVVIPPEAQALIDEAVLNGEDVWRITATLFPHYLGDKRITVLKPFRVKGRKYPTIFAGELDEATLKAIFGAKAKRKGKNGRMRRPIRTW